MNSLRFLAILGFLKSIGEWFYEVGLNLGGPGLLLIAVADSSFLTIPEGNDLLIVALSIGASWSRMAYLVSMTVIGSVTGCVLLFLVGRRGGRAVLEKRFSERNVRRAESYMQRYGLYSVIIPSILPPPMPFKVFVLTAGVFQLSTGRFLVAVIIGRSIRYFTWGILSVIYGEWVKSFIIDHIKQVGIVLLVFFLVIVLGIVLRHLWNRQELDETEVQRS